MRVRVTKAIWPAGDRSRTFKFVYWADGSLGSDFPVVEYGGEISDPWWDNPLKGCNEGTLEPDDELPEFFYEFTVERQLDDGTWVELNFRTEAPRDADKYFIRQPVVWNGVHRSPNRTRFLPAYWPTSVGDFFNGEELPEGMEVIYDGRRSEW